MSRRTLPVRRLAVAALAPLALSTMVACSDGDPGTTAVDETSSSTSSDPTEDAPTEDAPTEAAPTEEGVAAGETIEPAAFMDTFEGAFAEATTAHMTMNFTSAMGDMTAEGDADYSKTPPDMSMTMGGAALQGQEMQMVMVDGVMYMKMPTMGEKWMKLDLNDPSNPLGSMSGQMDPKAMFESFGDSLGEVTYVGETDIDGDAVKEYSVTVDTAAILESQGLGDVPQAGDTPKQMTYSMFFADDGLFRRMQIDMGETMGQMTMDLTDWGSDVSIEAPPAGEVTDFDMGSMMPNAPTS